MKNVKTQSFDESLAQDVPVINNTLTSPLYGVLSIVSKHIREEFCVPPEER